MLLPVVIAQSTAPNASTVFYWTLLFIFLTAIVTALVTKWARDKALKFFDGYHVTLERTRGQTTWGTLRVFSSGIEIIYDHPYIDPRGRKKNSFLIYGHELDSQILSLLRYHDELDATSQKHRQKQVSRSFNPGPMKRFLRSIRNVINTLRDAFSAAIGAAVGQFQRMNPASAVLSSQSQNVTQIGQALLGRIAQAYEPLLEQYIGRPVILDVVDPINPNHATVQYAGYLADYTQQFIALFNVDHPTAQEIVVPLPDLEKGDAMPPIPAPPPAGAPPIALPPPMLVHECIAVRVDGPRFRIQNTNADPVIVRRIERDGFEPIEFGMTLPCNGMLDLPARDARNGRLVIELVRKVDILAPRKYAIVRHAGEIIEKRGLVDELYLDQLPLVPMLLRGREESQDDAKRGLWAEGD